MCACVFLDFEMNSKWIQSCDRKLALAMVVNQEIQPGLMGRQWANICQSSFKGSTYIKTSLRGSQKASKTSLVAKRHQKQNQRRPRDSQKASKNKPHSQKASKTILNEHPEAAQRLRFQMQEDGVSPGSRELRYE